MNLTLIIVLCVTVFLVSLVLLYLPKIIKFFKKFSSKKKSKKKKNKKDDKIKASKVVEQIRPVVKPKDEKKAKEETKDIESKKQGTKKLNAPEQKAIDFKYSANKKKSLVESIDEYDKNNAKPTKNKEDYNPYNITTGKGNPLNRDIKKEFEDIRKFLDLPENQTGGNLQKKYEQTKTPKINSPLDFSNSKRIDASLFNEPSSHYADYRNTNNTLNYNNNENLNVMRTNTKYSKPVPYEPVVNNNNGPIKGYTYKIDRKKSFLPTINKDLNYDKDEYLNFEEENIDLNKLSPKLKRMIITNILKRKNFD